MVDTRKFSEFLNAGTQVEGQTNVGLESGANARFTTAPQFLPAGTTGTRPDPATAGMIRYNTSLNLYEFYNGSVWAQFEDSADIALLIARLAAHTPGDGASMIGLQNQGSVINQTVQDLAEADFIVKTDTSSLANAVALSGLSTGFLVNETGTGNLVARSVAGTASQITVTNGNGLSGNPTFEIANNPTLPGSTHVQIPFGNTAARPGSPANGYFRYNTQTDELEYWNNNTLAWISVVASDSNFGLTDGQLLIGDTGNPAARATLTAGTGISIANSPGGIEISTSGGGFAVVGVAGTSQSVAVNTTYVALNAGQTTFTMPSTFSFGDVVQIMGSTANTGGWVINAAAGDTIRVNNSTTTSGGSVTSAAVAGQTIELICDVANTSWVMMDTASVTLTTA